MNTKTELLLPAGNIESFFAAMQAGADAIYLGLESFNARKRASNFTRQQLVTVLNEAHKNGVLIYITLNTIVKNNELPELIDYLFFLENVGIDGIIIQDWGVFYLVSKYFPGLKIHASTQLAIHNSTGTKFLVKKGFKRVVLARELTLPELIEVVRKAELETEVFVHGSLCYSFSGMCLFSSFIGGRGANRGLCGQPCRREYGSKSDKKFLFNLKDNQLSDFVPMLTQIGVNSLKIEGRLKSGEYTCRVGRAYRKILDNLAKVEEAKLELELDLGREKTSYFIGGDLKNAISNRTGTGIYLGEIVQIFKDSFVIDSLKKLEQNYRLRIHVPNIDEPVYITVNKILSDGSRYRIYQKNRQLKTGSKVFLVKINENKFQQTLEASEKVQSKIAPSLKNSILKKLRVPQNKGKDELFFRINSPDWFSRINFNELDGLFVAFSKKLWNEIVITDFVSVENRNKVYIELPKFISEKSIKFYSDLVEDLVQQGFKNFSISHLSQKLLIPEGCRIIANENIYTFNDAAIQCIAEEGVETFVYPLETDFETLESISNKSGIVPVFFYPELFYSRMPVNLKGDIFISDDEKTKFRRYRKNGITCIIPERAVSILQHKNKLNEKGFYRFLIDVSYDYFSKNRLKTLKTRFLKSEQIQPSTTFNFMKGLK